MKIKTIPCKQFYNAWIILESFMNEEIISYINHFKIV